MIDGAAYDIGAFVFNTNHRLLTVFPDVAGCFIRITGKYSSVTPRGTLDDYPITVRGYLRDNGMAHFCRACMDVAFAKVRYTSRDTLTAYVKYYLGNSIYTRSGLKSYIERLYNIPDDEVDIEFATKRMLLIRDSASLRKVVVRLARRREIVFNADAERLGELVRPREGFDRLYAQIDDILRERGVTVLRSCEINEVHRAGSGFEIVAGGERRVYDRVISTIPLEAMAGLLCMSPVEGPEYMRLFSLFYRFRGDCGHGATVLYNFTYEGRWKRATMFSKYYGEYQGDQYFSVEGTVPPGEDGDLLPFQTDFETHVTRLGLYRGQLLYQGGLMTGHAYPLYRKANTARAAALKDAIRRMGIDIAGRQGELDYISSADAAGNAEEVATRVAASLASGGRTST
jgi:hypothetical protein